MLKQLAVVLCAAAAVACGTPTSGPSDGGGTTGGDAGFFLDGGVLPGDGGLFPTDGGAGDGGSGAQDGGTGGDGGTVAVPGSGTVTGSVGGSSVAAQDAFTQVDPNNQNNATVIVTETPSACASAQSGAALKNKKSLRILLRNITSNGDDPLTPGDYTINNGSNPPGLVATAALVTSDAQCVLSALATADSGTVTITSVGTAAGASTVGTFSLTFGSQTVTGSFDAPFCPSVSSTNASCH